MFLLLLPPFQPAARRRCAARHHTRLLSATDERRLGQGGPLADALLLEVKDPYVLVVGALARAAAEERKRRKLEEEKLKLLEEQQKLLQEQQRLLAQENEDLEKFRSDFFIKIGPPLHRFRE